MVSVDPVLVGIALALLLFFLFSYLWIRRTVTAFGQGYRQGKD